ncbi:hypothetical protein FEM03_14830 [Phragmitibacter flavus]|uniref:DUF1826 domain-containing protein n=1 Tax=Phragmitibacter flavus TaxID=2576071 RepID=A0A5R8KCI9_9BACT|nr:hypothetical protein [Phragmitibacter flavus]TLD70003.1 hypothetical protein FEM03_14830 [Phragmitibacter flavus]
MPPPLPADYPRIKRVASFHELITTPFSNGINAVCWPRTLPGDFAEVVDHLNAPLGITTIDEDQLQNLSANLTPAGQLAVSTLLNDQRLLREHGLDPVLDTVNGYLPPDEPEPLRTDVCSFHVDSATAEADTWLCTYFGASSELLRNDQAQRHIDIPATREHLLAQHGGKDDADFLEYLSDYCYDLHYVPLPNAEPVIFGLHNLWRIAVQYPGSPVPPCIHRAPDPIPGQPPRLLLIS